MDSRRLQNQAANDQELYFNFLNLSESKALWIIIMTLILALLFTIPSCHDYLQVFFNFNSTFRTYYSVKKVFYLHKNNDINLDDTSNGTL